MFLKIDSSQKTQGLIVQVLCFFFRPVRSGRAMNVCRTILFMFIVYMCCLVNIAYVHQCLFFTLGMRHLSIGFCRQQINSVIRDLKSNVFMFINKTKPVLLTCCPICSFLKRQGCWLKYFENSRKILRELVQI